MALSNLHSGFICNAWSLNTLTAQDEPTASDAIYNPPDLRSSSSLGEVSKGAVVSEKVSHTRSLCGRFHGTYL